MNPNDEQISAWLDGSLPNEELAAFEAAMDSDPDLVARIERLQGNDASLRAAFPLDDTISDALLTRLGLAQEAPVKDAQIIDFAKAREQMAQRSATVAPDRQGRRWVAGGALAASLALGLIFLRPSSENTSGAMDQTDAFQTAMQTSPSSRPAQLADGSTITPVLSFRAGDGRYCREFATPRENGIACRTDEKWSIEALTHGGTAPVETSGGGIRTAAGADGASLEAAYTRLKASDPLSGVQENDLITKSWKISAK